MVPRGNRCSRALCSGQDGAVVTAASPPNSTVFDLVLLVHVGAAIVSLIVVIASWSAARSLRSVAPNVQWPEAATRYFRPSPEVAGRALYAVPVTGFTLIGISHHSVSISEPFILIGLLAWMIAIAAAEHLIFATSHDLARLMREGPVPADDPWRALPKKVRLGADLVAVMLLLTTVVMVAQP